MKQKKLVLVLLSLVGPLIARAAPLNTAFTYQGRLTDGSNPAEGDYDFQFILFNAAVGGSAVGNTNTLADVPVTNGLFVVSLDFGVNAFVGDARWLEISVRPGASASAFTTLAPRQPLTPAPYALFAPTAGAVPNGAITSNMLANFAVNSSKLATGAVTSVQLADSIGLGSSNVTGRLDVYATTAGTPALSLIGGINQLSIYADDGREKTRLDSSPGWGQLQLFNSSSIGQHAAILTANAVGGGSLTLYSSNGAQRAVIFGANAGGELELDNGAGTTTIDLLANGSQISTFGTSGREHVRLWGPSYGEVVVYSGVSNNQPAGTLSANGNSGGTLSLNNTNGTSRAFLSGANNGGVLTLYQASGIAGLQASGAANQLSTFGSDGQERVRLWGPAYGEVLLYDQVGHTETVQLTANADSGGQLSLRNGNGTTTVTLQADDGLGSGQITTQVLQITGGADLSEQFEVKPDNAALEPGMVVCIDPERPGELTISSQAYDRRVAGVLSGAGGIKPGMLMGQAGTMAQGKHPVALTGRVYCKAEASRDPIQPGDLLTTSETPGHAMKVKDYPRAQGAIIGKAMSSLEHGTGLVLVLVSLQ